MSILSGRENIRAKATELFAENGYDGVSVRDIARASGITLPTLYHHFGDKRSLYEAIVRDAYMAISDSLLGVLTENAALPPGERLESFVVAHIEALSSDHPHIRILDRELLQRDPSRMVEVSTQLLGPAFDEVTKLIRHLAPDRDAPTVAYLLCSMVVGAVKMAPLQSHLTHGQTGGLSSRLLARQAMSLMAAGLFGTLK